MQAQSAAARPLHLLRVVDLATGPLAGIGRHLAELGADVIRVEPRGGAADRAQAPSAGGVGLTFASQNAGKRAVGLDLADAAGRVLLEGLIAGADVLIEAFAPGSAEAALLDVAGIAGRSPALVILSATPFGQTGDYAQFQASDAVLHALSGGLSRSGIPGREPLLPPDGIAISCAIAQAVYVILLALLARMSSGLGDHLDLSLLEAASQALDPGFGIAGSASLGVAASDLPRGRHEARHQYPIIPCADGHVRICVLAPRQWQGMFEWMGRPVEFADPSFAQLSVRFASPDLVPAIARFFAGKTRAELEEAGQRFGVPTAALLTLAEALQTPQIVARGALRDMTVAPGVTLRVPAGVLEIDGRRAGTLGAPPDLLDVADWHDSARIVTGSAEPGAAGPPLAGLLVLDFGVIVVGAEQGRLLADHGADVIKVETAAFPDGSRQSKAGGRIAPTFAAGHFNKRSLGINLRDPRGRDLLLRLVGESDVILSNFKPGTLESLGLGYDRLHALNPRLIMVDSSAFGPTGPWSGRLGYGPLVRASTGLTAQWRYDGEAESFSDAMTVYPDHAAARIGAIGALALLIRRARTGRGGTASIAQNEVMLSQMAERVAMQTVTCQDAVRDAPFGVFPCAGDDEWCVVTVRGDADWHRLCVVIARPDLAADADLAVAEGRHRARARIDAAMTEWTRDRAPVAAMEALQRGGVAAGAMLRVADLPEFAYFAARGTYREVSHPHLDRPFFRDAAPVQSRHLPDPPDRPAPLMGEHTREIAAERLGLREDEIASLIESGILEGVEA